MNGWPQSADEMGIDILGSASVVDATLSEVVRLRRQIEPLIDAPAVALTGTGMSLAVALAAAPLWRRATGATVEVREAADVALGMDAATLQPGQLVVVLSKSGSSPESVGAMKRAIAADARAVAVTARPDSRLAELAPITVFTPIGNEGGPGTRSASCALAALLGMCGSISTDAVGRRQLQEQLGATESDPADLEPATAVLAKADRTWIAGWGSGMGLARAAGVLWHEKVHRQGLALSIAEFRHGPIEAARKDDALVIVRPEDATEGAASYLDHLGAEASSIGLRIVWLTPEVHDDIHVPLQSEGSTRTLEALIRLQQLARLTAHAAGTYRDGFDILRSIVKPVPEL